MVKNCAVPGCLSNSKHDKNRHFYKFPAHDNRRKKWIQACHRPELAIKSIKTLVTCYFVCDIHFQESDYFGKQLKGFVVPTVNLPLQEITNPSKFTQTDTDQTEVSISQKDAACQIDNWSPSATLATQTTLELYATTPLKRKFQTELRDESKRQKILETETEYKDNNEKSQLDQLINLQNQLRQNSRCHRYHNKYKLLALNMYLASPLAYRVLAKTMNLPNESTLRCMNIKTGTKLHPNIYDCLKFKLKSFKDFERYCIICVDEISLRRRLYYVINQDKIVGFHEIDGIQTTEPASRAFVIMARGIFSNWEQQLGYSTLGQSENYKEVNEWVDLVISNVINIGYKVVAFVSDQGSNSLNLAMERGISIDKPYFYIDDKKIYHIFDVPRLIRSFRNKLMKYDFEYVDIDDSILTAKWKDLKIFYRQDSKRSFRLVPKLTKSHVNPDDYEKMNVKMSVQVFSRTVAAAMNSSIESGHLERSATGTVKLFDMIDKTFDILNSSAQSDSNEYKNAFSFEPYQIEELDRFYLFLSTVTVRSKTKKDVTNSVKCLEGLKISIRSIKRLANHLLSDRSRFLYTRRLNLDPLEDFFGSIKVGNCREPTPIQFTRSFRKLFMMNMLKHSKNTSCSDDLHQLLVNAEDTLNKTRSLSMEDSTADSQAVAVGTVDYRFDLPLKKVFPYICGYLLNKCAQKHKCDKICEFIKHCISISSRTYYENQLRLMNPPDSFVNFVKRIDERFKQCIQQNINKSVGSVILKRLEDFTFTECCECFPNDYLKRLFVRFRIYNTIKFNNLLLRDTRCKRQQFSVCNI